MAWPRPPTPPYDFYDHAIQRMNQRGVLPGDIQAVLENPSDVMEQSNGNVVYFGRCGIGVVVDGTTGQIVTVIVQ